MTVIVIPTWAFWIVIGLLVVGAVQNATKLYLMHKVRQQDKEQ